MVDWSDSDFLTLLIIDLLAIGIAVWWLSTKFTTKMREVEERMSRARLRDSIISEDE